MSQENVSDKVRNLQRQIAHNIKFGQKPQSMRKSEGDEGSSDEDDVPRSPLRVQAQVEAEPEDAKARETVSSITHDVTQHKTPVKSPRTKRPPPPGTIESINLDDVPQSGPCLDNTAAKHKLSVKPKNQRVSRKHRRFTQELLEVDISAALQEEADVQKFMDEPRVWKEEYARSPRARDDHEQPEKSKKQRLQEEEQERLCLQRKQQHEEQRRKEEERRAEELRLEAERRRRLLEEECMRREEEERRQWEEERRRIEEEERKRRLEEQRLREEEKKKQQEEEERKMREEEARRRAEEERRQQELEAERVHLHMEEEKRKKEAEAQRRRKEEEEAEKQRLKALEELRRREEEERLLEEQRQRQEEEAEKKRLAEENKRKEEEDRKRQQEEERAAEEAFRASDPEWKRKAEELRWREMEERQRPFTFKVSSGEKQILFQKVNLTPVSPVHGQQGDTAEETKDIAPGAADSPTLSSSLYVPHTAILVTGAQLCGTAVNLDQIKDSACKSLLGLSEDKKAMGTPPVKSKTSPDRKSGKTKSLNESSLSTDQSSAAVLAEWASIRSKIFKGAEDGKYQEYPDQNRKQTQSRTTSEDLNDPPFYHANLRKTMSASAKFSITPARKKFADSNRNSEVFSQDDQEGGKDENQSPDSSASQPLHSTSPVAKAQSKIGKTVRISDSAEECKFAKDLPSFLVPSPPHGSPKSQRSETVPTSPIKADIMDSSGDGDQRDQSDERPSPFGIKLRRTNYSLRFHSEQSIEKRKKRYSAGDSFEGVPVPLTSTDQDLDSSALSEKTSLTSPLRETDGVKPETISSLESRSKTSRNILPSMSNECEKLVKPPLYQKPATNPKKSEGATPPPSPLPKHGIKTSADIPSQKTGGLVLVTPEESSDRKDDTSESSQSQKSVSIQGDDEPKEKKSFFPSISIPWREKTDRRTELIRKEKPSLQSRHSLDSSRAQEKEAGPLWITLALQKQKGFREQQQSREEKRNQREAKLAEKQARDRESVGLVSPTEGKGNGNSSPPKPQTPEENKRPDTLLARFERRDLKKANTLPSSVTVEIADSTPSPPAAKDIKRFPPSDTPQVSTEPAWLALAKRKAKAWSDCPQIIK
ncbi:capping protein inhibiting regulator of actin dynamics isoform X2 [Hoplias malabaricus]